MGSHNSDLEAEPVGMRTMVLPLLEDMGVDLVLSGHSHSYERSMLLDSHYGRSSSLRPCNMMNSGRGSPSLPYLKPTGFAPHAGAVYIVSGSSGKIERMEPSPHPVMAVSTMMFGSLALNVTDTHLTGEFVTDSGAVADTFVIAKVPGFVPRTKCT
jgi:hypothetical protein